MKNKTIKEETKEVLIKRHKSFKITLITVLLLCIFVSSRCAFRSYNHLSLDALDWSPIFISLSMAYAFKAEMKKIEKELESRK